MAPPATLPAALGPYLLVQWADGVEVEGSGLIAWDAEALVPLLETANDQAALVEEPLC